jgi:hemoglobin-like flavoprotein
MGPVEYDLIRSSFPEIERVSHQAGTVFYRHLFSIAPEVLPQFRRDLSDPSLQPAAAHRFMQLVSFIRTAAECCEADRAVGDEATVQKLALRHVKYHTEAAHYEPLRRAFVFALEQCLGASFTPAIRNAWTQAYDRLAVAMVQPLAQVGV